ncbi:MAG: hypothetical protein FWH33_09235 [Oscillospiraceae bacterium]|nr:hypothetical protein [Oscillospiraceae bacterium]
MANYDDLKKKAKDALGTIADVSVEAYKLAEEKARILAKRAKLNTEITREKGLVRRLKSEIGNKYYELHKDDAEEAFATDCASITDALARIDAKKREIEELKTTGGAACDCGDDCCDDVADDADAGDVKADASADADGTQGGSGF